MLSTENPETEMSEPFPAPVAVWQEPRPGVPTWPLSMGASK